jgi:hypothetical protein
MTDSKSSSKSSFLMFWTTLPGILTGVASVVAAVVAAITLFSGGGNGSTNGGGGTGEIVTQADWGEEANKICAEAYEDIRALGIPPDPASQFAAIPQMTRITTRADQKLQALERPAETESKIEETLELSSRATATIRNAYNYWRAGDIQRAQALLEEYDSLALDGQRLVSELGANVCAQGP